MFKPTKQVIVIDQASTTNGATASGNIDTLGYDFATIDIITSTSDAATNNPAALKLSEADDTNTASFVDITAFVGDGTGGFTIPNSVTQGSWGVKFNLNLRHRKRYIKVEVSPITTQVITAIANLGDASITPVNTTDVDVKALVQG